MSDETIPKLRLKPKLVVDPSAAPAAASEAKPSAEVPASAPEESPSVVRLKPRITVAAEPVAKPETAAIAATEVAPDAPSATPEQPKAFRLKPKISLNVASTVAAAPVSPQPDAPPPTPPVETPSIAADAGAPKFSLKPKVGVAPELPTSAIPPPEVAPAVAEAGIAPEATVPTAPPPAGNFPPPVAKFPPPPGAKKAPVTDAAAAETSASPKPGSRKKLLMVGVGVIGVAAIGVGYFLFLQSPPELPPLPPRKSTPAVVANPTTVQGQAVAAAQKAVEKANEQMAPLNEVIAADQSTAATTPATPTRLAEVAKPVAVAPAPPVELPPPPPSSAFREWVANLHIGSLRTGAKPRILIEKTSYDVGDTVSQNLGITFEGYNALTRMIIFKDRSGATVERRN